SAPPPAPATPPAAAPAPAPAPTVTPQNARLKEKLAEGDRALREKGFAAAIVAYGNAAKLDPKSEEALFKLGVAYALAGNHKVAILKWEQVLKLNPGNEAARRNIERAKKKLSSGPEVKDKPVEPAPPPRPTAAARPELPAAKPAATEPPPAAPPPAPAAAASSADFEKFMGQAEAAKRKGDAAAVLEAVDQALSIRQDEKALLLRGEALVILKRYAEAKYAFGKVLAINQNLAAPLFGLGEASRLAGDVDRAKYYFKLYAGSKASDVNPALVKKAEEYLASH
ncbi:MAG: tetratricopeptide repeat protein, partial [Myxococcales bacterium]|nr:tetratricopeptide repeat protein [Myxococcales bacterium]